MDRACHARLAVVGPGGVAAVVLVAQSRQRVVQHGGRARAGRTAVDLRRLLIDVDAGLRVRERELREIAGSSRTAGTVVLEEILTACRVGHAVDASLSVVGEAELTPEAIGHRDQQARRRRDDGRRAGAAIGHRLPQASAVADKQQVARGIKLLDLVAFCCGVPPAGQIARAVGQLLQPACDIRVAEVRISRGGGAKLQVAPVGPVNRDDPLPRIANGREVPDAPVGSESHRLEIARPGLAVVEKNQLELAGCRPIDRLALVLVAAADVDRIRPGKVFAVDARPFAFRTVLDTQAQMLGRAVGASLGLESGELPSKRDSIVRARTAAEIADAGLVEHARSEGLRAGAVPHIVLINETGARRGQGNLLATRLICIQIFVETVRQAAAGIPCVRLPDLGRRRRRRDEQRKK